MGRQGGVEGQHLIKTQEVQELKFTDMGLKHKKAAPQHQQANVGHMMMGEEGAEGRGARQGAREGGGGGGGHWLHGRVGRTELQF